MYRMIEVVNAILPADRPRYLSGGRTPTNILEAIGTGRGHVRLRDADAQRPQRAALHVGGDDQHPQTRSGRTTSRRSIREGTTFDRRYSKAYLHHLVTCGEMMAAQIASLHNIAFYLRLVRAAREHILAGDFKEWKEAAVAKLGRRL